MAEQCRFLFMLPWVHPHVLFSVVQDLGSPTIEEQVDQPTIDDETVLIVPSSHGFIQATDDMDNESVLPLTTLTGMTVPVIKAVYRASESLQTPLHRSLLSNCKWPNKYSSPEEGSPCRAIWGSALIVQYLMHASVSPTIASISIHIGHCLPSLKILKPHLDVVLCNVL